MKNIQSKESVTSPTKVIIIMTVIFFLIAFVLDFNIFHDLPIWSFFGIRLRAIIPLLLFGCFISPIVWLIYQVHQDNVAAKKKEEYITKLTKKYG